MSLLELALVVVGIVSLARKARPDLDGWGVVVTVFAMSLAVLGARAAVADAPSGVLFQVLAVAAGVGAAAVGLVHLADRMARPRSMSVRAVLPTSAKAPGAPPSSDSDPPPIVHRVTVGLAVALLLVCADCSTEARGRSMLFASTWPCPPSPSEP